MKSRFTKSGVGPTTVAENPVLRAQPLVIFVYAETKLRRRQQHTEGCRTAKSIADWNPLRCASDPAMCRCLAPILRLVTPHVHCWFTRERSGYRCRSRVHDRGRGCRACADRPTLPVTPFLVSRAFEVEGHSPRRSIYVFNTSPKSDSHIAPVQVDGSQQLWRCLQAEAL